MGLYPQPAPVMVLITDMHDHLVTHALI
jgi:hypothetical protein